VAEPAEVLQPTEEDVPRTVEGIRALVKRARAGDESTVPVIRKMLQNPQCIPAFGGHLAEQVIGSFLSAIGGKNVGFREAVERKLDLMREELLGTAPPPIERLLVERIVACWLQVQDAEMRYAQGQDDMSIRQGDFRQRRMDATNRRFLAAVKALALVRKLAVPVLQVNIAKKQVNVAANALTAADVL
jgi:hypothetical protein